MTVRSTMANLITRTRTLIADQIAEQFDGQAIQDALDMRRTTVRYLALTEVETIQPGGSVVYLDYHAPYGDWEEGVSLVDGSYAPLTPEEENLQLGEWIFSSNQRPPVYLIGKTYDLYGAAADLLEQWMAAVKQQYDFRSHGRDFARSQQGKAMLQLIGLYRGKQRLMVGSLERSDVNALGL